MHQQIFVDLRIVVGAQHRAVTEGLVRWIGERVNERDGGVMLRVSIVTARCLNLDEQIEGHRTHRVGP